MKDAVYYKSFFLVKIDAIALALCQKEGFVVQTDISSFYEHIYHHRIENCIADLFSTSSTVATQIDRLLSHIAAGRSFGLPVGGQCSRVLAELLMTSTDQLLTQSGLVWHRYVDDFTIIANSQANAYRAISILSNALADYGLSLNKTKTTILSARHYSNFVQAQLFSNDDNASKLKEIDLHFDPYSDNAHSDYKELSDTIEQLDVQKLLDLEIHKSQPDSFLVSQISRTLKLHKPSMALKLCKTLLSSNNLHSFRASWSTIIRGVISLRSDNNYGEIHECLDPLIDGVMNHSEHLLLPEASCLHYLRALRIKKTDERAKFVFGKIFKDSCSVTLQRVCIECMRNWKDRANFNTMRNQWNKFDSELQRMFWLSSYQFGDEGEHFRLQVKKSISNTWVLGFEIKDEPTFHGIYTSWAKDNNEIS